MIKRICFIVVVLFFCCCLGCSSDDSPSVRVLQWGVAEVYYDAYNGLTESLGSKGYKPGVNIDIKRVIAKGDYDLAKRVINRWKNESPDLIVTIGTKATLAAKEVLHPESSSIPLVFVGCAFPHLTGVIDSYHPQKGITGIGAETPVRERVNLLLRVLPHIKRVVIPYFPDNPQAGITATEARAILEEKGVRAITLALSKKEGPRAAVRKIGKISSQCDVIYLPTDPVLYVPSTLKGVIDEALSKGKPTTGVTINSVKSGALLALYSDYYEQGVEAADMVDMVLHGTPPRKIAPRPGQSHYLAINIGSARALGINIPRSIMLEAREIIDINSDKDAPKLVH